MIRHHLKLYGALLKVTAEKLQISLYIANCVTSNDSEAELQTLAHQAIPIMARAKGYLIVPRNGQHDRGGKGEDGLWQAGTNGVTCVLSWRYAPCLPGWQEQDNYRQHFHSGCGYPMP